MVSVGTAAIGPPDQTPMTVYPTTLCFARNTSSETQFVCKECAKEQTETPFDDLMDVGYHTEMTFIRCSECRTVIRDS